MAWLEPRPNGTYHIAFRYDGQKFKKSLRTRSQREAETRLHRVDENIRLIEAGRLSVPHDADIANFLLSDGKLGRHKTTTPPKKRLSTFRQYATAFLAAIPAGSLEPSTIHGMEVHLRHLIGHYGARFALADIDLADIQAYVDARSKADGLRGRPLSPATIKKEVTTLRTLWNWARSAGQVERRLPLKGLRYPKGKEKPPFQTFAEIERRIARGGLTESQVDELWSALFLTTDEIDQLLGYVEHNAKHACLLPMFTFAAHTGARRSEMLRSQIDDLDFTSRMIIIREKKRVRGQLTTRSVPMSSLLHDVLGDWLHHHPGGNATFTLGVSLRRSKKTREFGTGLTRDEAHDHFRRTLHRTRWRNAKGWHLFRHSFCSNCAAAGVDQRVINGWVGHQTEAMVKRYRHLIPHQQHAAMASVFG